MKLKELPTRSLQTTHAEGGTGARTQIEVNKALSGFGTDDAREMGYRPLPLKQRKFVKLNERPARSVQTTLAERGTAPTHSSRKRM